MHTRASRLVIVGSVAGFLAVAFGVVRDVRSAQWVGWGLLALCMVVSVFSAIRRSKAIADVDPSAGESAAQRTLIEADAAPVGVEPSDALEALVRATGSSAAALSAHLWLLDPTTRTVRHVAHCGPVIPADDPLPVETSIPGRAAESGTAVLERTSVRSAGGERFVVRRFAVPLQAGEARGCAVIDFAEEDLDVAAITHAAAMSRGALAAALALHVSRGETSAISALVDATSELLQIVDSENLVKRAVEHAVRLSDADTASVLIKVPGSKVMSMRASVGLPPAIARDVVVGEGDGIAGWVLSSGKPVVVEDIEDRGPNSRRHGVRSSMAVPIMDGDEILGVLNVGSRTFHARFSASRLTVLESLGRVVAIGLRNAAAAETSRDLYLETIKALALALETKDPYSRGATQRVYDLTLRLAALVGLDDVETRALGIAALLHDIGMASLGGGMTTSASPLSTVEWCVLKMHPAISAEVLEQAPALRAAVPIVYHHHERFDGGGYATGLSGEQIPLGARVLSVADAYVAMTSPRPYRPAMTVDEALAEIRFHAGTQFDPLVVSALPEALAGDAGGLPDKSRLG